MDANVDQLCCVLDRPTAAGIHLEHEISNRAERRLLRDPGGRGPALAHRHLHFQKRKVEAEDGVSAQTLGSMLSRTLISKATVLLSWSARDDGSHRLAGSFEIL